MTRTETTTIESLTEYTEKIAAEEREHDAGLEEWESNPREQRCEYQVGSTLYSSACAMAIGVASDWWADAEGPESRKEFIEELPELIEFYLEGGPEMSSSYVAQAILDYLEDVIEELVKAPPAPLPYVLWVGGDREEYSNATEAYEAYTKAASVHGVTVVQLCQDGYDVVGTAAFTATLRAEVS